MKEIYQGNLATIITLDPEHLYKYTRMSYSSQAEIVRFWNQFSDYQSKGLQPEAITGINIQGQLVIADAVCRASRDKKPDIQELFG
ncbi:hypothetical protein FJZ21_03210 [Candidatus Pacearchaeota archaeon]|nr:hypothetical protein [Candidatus Pacearchaeota archaeon]